MTTETVEPHLEWVTLTTRIDARSPDVIYHDAPDGSVMTMHIAEWGRDAAGIGQPYRCPHCYGALFPRVVRDAHVAS